MNVKIVKINDMQGVIATIDADAGDIVYEFRGEIILYPTRTSVQIGREHIEEDMIAYVNHSCTPNVSVEDMRYNDWNMFGTYALISTEVIVAGDEITFDYNSTENEIAYPFKCSCHGTLIRGKNYVKHSSSNV
jgi:hypothetical protein